jgi:hypothetical protein
MLGSEILDVAIGMVFIYLLLSLVVSAINEGLEHMLKNRAKYLECGLRELLGGKSAIEPLTHSGMAGAKSLIARVYDHGLIYSLYQGEYDPQKTTNLPSYIPSRSFALALMDIVLPGAGTAGAVAAPRSNPGVVVNAYLNPPVEPTGPPPAMAVAPPNPLQPLRDAVSAIQNNERVRQALLTAVDSAGHDAVRARQNIEEWYNSAMDRVSGWYKRRAQLYILAIGLLLAVGMNINSISLANRLWVNKAQRDALVAAAQNYSKGESSTKTPALSANGDGGAHAASVMNPTAPSVASHGAVGGPSETRLDPGLEASLKRLNRLGFQIGWHFRKASDEKALDNEIPTGIPDFQEVGRLQGTLAWILVIVGWFVTAFAISLGAPFWFDLLNKFIQMRAAVKPAEENTAGAPSN